MTRPDRYDYIGMALLALIIALWVAHFVEPAAPPPASEIGSTLPGQSLLGPPH